MDGFRRKATAWSFAHTGSKCHSANARVLHGRARAIARPNEGAQDLDVVGAHAKEQPDPPHLEQMNSTAATVLYGLGGAACFTFGRFRARRMTPRLVAAG